MKRTPNPEQLARREKMREVAAQIARMSDVDRFELAARAHVVTVAGHALSVHNACMVAAQKPDATIIGGFRQWLTAGRCVQKGEHGIAIWCPAGKRAEGAEGAETGDDTDKTKPRFILVTVFDVSQTAELADTNADSATAAPTPAPMPTRHNATPDNFEVCQ